MILKNTSKNSPRRAKLAPIYMWLALAALLFAMGWLAFGPNGGQSSSRSFGDFVLVGDAEKVSGDKFILGDWQLDGAAARSDEQAFEGKYSVKLSAQGPQYGFGSSIDNLQQGDHLRLQVWVYSPKGQEGYLVFASDKEGEMYEQTAFIRRREGDWGLIELDVQIKKPLTNNKGKFFCYTTGPQVVYFDNLSLAAPTKNNYTWKPLEVNLHIKDGDFGRLKMKRDEALEKGLLMTEESSWVDGAIYSSNEKEDKIKVSLRLKGDWVDHLQGDKWSFRVSTEPEKSWQRLKVFSLQNPSTRAFMKEWILHQFFLRTDVLTTRYDFIKLRLNDRDLGLYVYEEHFTKQIPEYNRKREGPIVKFSETSLWTSRLQAKGLDINLRPEEEKITPDVQPFGEKRTAQDPKLAQQFALAQNLLYEYQYQLRPVSQIFDVDILAKYYAVADVTGGHHGVIWHNQRYYYNPITGKLEPIGFDGFDETGETWVYPPFMGMQESDLNAPKVEFHAYLFRDAEFLAAYYKHLDSFSQPAFLSAFVDSIRQDFVPRYQALTEEFTDYSFSFDYLFARAKRIRYAMQPTQESIHIRWASDTLLGISNRHNTALEIVGTSQIDGGNVKTLAKPQLILRNPVEKIADFSSYVRAAKSDKYLVYRIPGLDKLYYQLISPWPVPEAFTPVQELAPNVVANSPDYAIDAENKQIIFAKKAEISAPLVIPQGYRVIFEAGSHLNIKNKAFLLSYSPVFWLGTEEQPIMVTSSDASANGIIVINADQRSKVNYTTFDNLNTLAYKGWNLTGAVTFYQSDVDIEGSTFTNNHCEDALNTVRCDFRFFKSTVSHTFGDGFDSDFCTGLVDRGYFYKTGNDGIDFSTSVVTIQHTNIKDVGDKGISIGEQGTATVINTKIDGAVIGIASKDLSRVTIQSIELNNCAQGFAAYQKKPEYGGGYLFVERYKAENTPQLYQILPGSYLKLVDKEIIGNQI